jgi:hypothetical protein
MILRYLQKYCVRARTAGAAAALLLLLGQGALAQDSGGCLLHPAKLSEPAVKSFKDRPADILANHPGGGLPMSAAVRRLAGSDVSTVSALVALAKDASVAQIVALGIGLARAAAVCNRLRPELAKRIQQEVEKAGIPALTAAFAAGVSQDDLAAAGTGGPVTSSDLIGSLQPAGGGAGADGPNTRRSAPPTDTTLSAARSAFGGGGVNQTVIAPVSPTR